MDIKYFSWGGTLMRKGLHLWWGKGIGASQPSWRCANFLVLIDDSPKGPMNTASEDLGTMWEICRLRDGSRDGKLRPGWHSWLRHGTNCRRRGFRSRDVLPRWITIVHVRGATIWTCGGHRITKTWRPRRWGSAKRTEVCRSHGLRRSNRARSNCAGVVCRTPMKTWYVRCESWHSRSHFDLTFADVTRWKTAYASCLHKLAFIFAASPPYYYGRG